MPRLLIAGNVNVETTLRVEAWPVPYQPATFVPFGIDKGVSGVGYNLAKALVALGEEVRLASIIGRDLGGQLVRATLAADGIEATYVLSQVDRTALSVVLYDAAGRRNTFVDLKDLMEQEYPPGRFLDAAEGCEAILLTQVAYARGLIATARAAHRLLATDLQTFSDIEDPYKLPYLEAVDIAFMSGERLEEPPEDWARRLLDRYPARILVISLGAGGALLAVRDSSRYLLVPPVETRAVVNTSGAGDALFAAFMHFYLASGDPEPALRKATVFASYKIGAAVSSEGFLDAAALEALYSSLGG